MTWIDSPEFILEEPEFDPWVDARGIPLLEVDLDDVEALAGTSTVWRPIEVRGGIGFSISSLASIWTID